MLLLELCEVSLSIFEQIDMLRVGIYMLLSQQDKVF